MTPPDAPTLANGPGLAPIPWIMKEGDSVSEYTICKVIGAGSDGVVYEVTNKEGTRFALKLSRFPLAASGKHPVPVERLYHSALAHFMLRDVPNVAQIAALNVLLTPQGAFPYLVLELVPDAESITDWAARAAPTLDNMVEVFALIASAVGAMASMKICHRDLKPQNILIAPGDVPMIVDLNSASIPIEKTITAPAASAIPGTPAYFSPELATAVLDEMISGKKARYAYAPTDDLYSLGCVFYQVLVGDVPRCSDLDVPPDSILRQIARNEPVHLTEMNPLIPFSVSKVIMTLLKTDPAERYQSGYDAACDLRTARYRTVDDRWFEPFIVQRREPSPKLPGWLAPVPSATIEPKTEAPRVERPRRRWAAKLALAATLTVAALAGWRLVVQDCPPESSAEKGPTVLCKVKMAIVAAFPALSCVGPTTNLRDLRAQDEEFLATCPAEARKTVKLLNIEPTSVVDVFDDGLNVRRPAHGYGYELRAGPIEFRPSNLNWKGGGTLYGDIRIGPDGASVRFRKLKLDSDGQERPICAIAYPGEDPLWFRKVPKDAPGRTPDSELHPNEGFIYVFGRGLITDFAH